MGKEIIYVIEDEDDIRELIRYNLQKNGYEVKEFSDGESFVNELGKVVNGCILLDLMLPGIDGLEVCKKVKRIEKLEKVPLIMVTARGEEADIVTGLEMGADDYMVKPFSPRVLIARIRSVLRRASEVKKIETKKGERLKVDDVEIIPGRHEVFIKGELLKLTASEFKALHFLMSHPGWVFTRNQIVEDVHGYDYPVTDRSIDVLIAGLRKKMGESGNLIETVRGIGYRFKD